MGSWEEGVCILPEVFQRRVSRGMWRGQGRGDSDSVGKPGSKKGCPYRSSVGLKLRVFFFFFWEGLRFEQSQRKELNPIMVDLKTQFSEGVF
jgi:hypothetical protein